MPWWAVYPSEFLDLLADAVHEAVLSGDPVEVLGLVSGALEALGERKDNLDLELVDTEEVGGYLLALVLLEPALMSMGGTLAGLLDLMEETEPNWN